MIGFSFLVLCVLASSEANECEVIRDVDVIVEIPPEGRKESIKEVTNFVKALANEAADSCWRPRISVADYELYHINNFECFSLECVSGGVETINWDAEETENDLVPKYNVIQALQEIMAEAENSVTLPGLDGPKRIILLILSTKRMQDVSIPVNINFLLEGGYDFIAVGIGDGRHVPLERIAFQAGRTFRLETFSQLNKSDKASKYKDIVYMLDNPDKEIQTSIEDSGNQKDSNMRFDHHGYDSGVCEFIADIAFLIDSSASIKEDTDYVKVKKFVIQIAKSFNISKEGTHAGTVVFSDRLPFTKVDVRLNDYWTNEGFAEAIQNSPYLGYRTRIDLGFKLALTDVFNPNNGARENVSKIVFLLTDGKQNPRVYNPLREAQELQKRDVKIFAVGITDEIDEEALELLTGESDRVFYAESFDTLHSHVFLRKISDASCKEGTLLHPLTRIPTTPVPTTTAPPTTTTTTTAAPTTEAAATTTTTTTTSTTTKAPEETSEVATTQGPKGPLGETLKGGEIGGLTKTGLPTEKGHFPPIEEEPCDDDANQIGCTGVGTCSTCCGGRDVYINIFQAGSGANYIMQGMKLQKSSSGTVTGVPVPKTRSNIQISSSQGSSQLSFEQLMNVIQGALPDKPRLVKTIGDLVKSSNDKPRLVKTIGNLVRSTYDRKANELPTSEITGIPSLAQRDAGVPEEEPEEEHEVGRRRKRRSITYKKNNDYAKISMAKKLVKEAGCNLFLTALKKSKIIKEINNLVRGEKDITIFCPIDAAFKKVYETPSLAANERDILLNHIGLKHDKYGIMYETLLPGGKIVFNPVGKGEKISWKANDVDVILSLLDSAGSNIVVTKDVIYPKTRTVAQVLKSMKDVNVFYGMFLKNHMKNIFETKVIKKICFAKRPCVSLTQSMQDHLKDAINFNQFTIIAPTNNMLANMEKDKLTSLLRNRKEQSVYLQEHIFLGSLGNAGSDHRGVVYSLSPDHALLTINMEKNQTLLVHGYERLLRVKHSIPVSEGTLYVVDEMV